MSRAESRLARHPSLTPDRIAFAVSVIEQTWCVVLVTPDGQLAFLPPVIIRPN